MIVTNQGQDRNKPAATIGFWAALLTAALNVWFFLAFVPAPAVSGVDRPLLFLRTHVLDHDDLSACLGSEGETNLELVSLSTRYHKIAPRFVALSQCEPIGTLGTNLR